MPHNMEPEILLAAYYTNLNKLGAAGRIKLSQTLFCCLYAVAGDSRVSECTL